MDIKEKIENLSVEKKAAVTTGADTWNTAACEELNLKSVHMSDGPNGMRMQGGRGSNLGLGKSLPATCFPTEAAIGCSFDEELAFAVGRRIAAEGAEEGCSCLLAPGLNIKRSPLCGRNFEYFSEDGYLSGKLAAAYVRGVQSTGVSACIKHFAVNSREYARMFCDSRIDEGTLRETYLTGFEIAVKEGKPDAAMTAYNKLNGIPCNENKRLVGGILRTEWGFDKLVVSDWGGSFDRVRSLEAGADLEMPVCKFSPSEIVSAVKCGELDEKYLNASVERICAFAEKADKISRKKADIKEHAAFAVTAAEQCMVLLKNENSALPLAAGERVAAVGDFARKLRIQGAGSSCVNAASQGNISGAIKNSGLKFIGFAKGFKRNGRQSRILASSAVRLAKKADTIVLCLGLGEMSESEGVDRTTLKIADNQIKLLKRLKKLGKKIVVLLNCGGSVLTDWDGDADALLLVHLAGQGGAQAAVNILCGKANPCGRLAETFPVNEGQEPCAGVYSSHAMKMDFAEGIYVGYKYFTSFYAPVKYPFGFGLSYTKFRYGDFTVSEKGVHFSVENTGGRGGATLAQVYVRSPRDLQISPSELKLFKKIYLDSGEKREVFLPFDEYSFRIWNEKLGCFSAGGEYEVSLCSDCQTPLFCGVVTITGENVPKGCAFCIPDGDKLDYKSYFARRLTDDVPPPAFSKGMPVSPDMPVTYLKYCKGFVAKAIGFAVAMIRKSKNPAVASAPEWLSVRTLMQYMGYDKNQRDGFLMACDGKFFKGVYKIIFKK